MFVSFSIQVPGLSPITPITSVLPLVFVVSVTMAKQGWYHNVRSHTCKELNPVLIREDYVRHLADKAVNSKPTKVISYGGNMLEILTKQVSSILALCHLCVKYS